MRQILRTKAILWGAAALVLAGTTGVWAKVGVGVRAPNFVLQNAQGETHALADFRDKKAVVLVFLGTECPVANLYVPDLVALQEKYAEQGVQFIAVNPNPGDTAEEIAKHAEEYKLSLPVWIDKDGRVAQTLGVTRTPEVLLLDEPAAVRYRGRIDDRFGVDYKRSEPTRSHDHHAARPTGMRRSIAFGRRTRNLANCPRRFAPPRRRISSLVLCQTPRPMDGF
jgi:peroxiredoxin